MENEELRKAHRISLWINGAIMASFLVYVICVEVIKAQYKYFAGFGHLHDLEMVRYIFYGLAIIQVIVIRLLRGFLLKKAPSDDRKTLIGKIQKTSLLTSALSEGPTIFGLVLFLLGGLSRDFYILLFVSLFLMFMYFPRYTQWEEWLKKNSPADCRSTCL